MKKSERLREWLRLEGIHDEAVLDAIAKVPRDAFVSEELKTIAYEDEALPIECGQTISQPFIVARMTELILGEGGVKKVLEIGTGSGYQAAVLAQIVETVYTVERYHTLLHQAERRFKKLGYRNIQTLHADGFLGWEAHAPFDAIIVTAAAPNFPESLMEQLADGGRMIIPIGQPYGPQDLYLITRLSDRFAERRLDPVVFVPMVPGVSEE